MGVKSENCPRKLRELLYTVIMITGVKKDYRFHTFKLLITSVDTILCNFVELTACHVKLMIKINGMVMIPLYNVKKICTAKKGMVTLCHQEVRGCEASYLAKRKPGLAV